MGYGLRTRKAEPDVIVVVLLYALSTFKLLEWNKQELLSFFWYPDSRIDYFSLQHEVSVILRANVHDAFNVYARYRLFQVTHSLHWIEFDNHNNISFQLIKLYGILQYIEQYHFVTFPVCYELKVHVGLADEVHI